MQPRTQQLLDTPVIGNFGADRPTWDIAHQIAADQAAPMEDRLAALGKMNTLTGENDPVDEAALAEYLEEAG